MLKRYTKGDKDNVVTRIEQVGDITLYIPSLESLSILLSTNILI